MRAYSVDLRERVVAAVKAKGMSKLSAAEVYGVSRATVYRYLTLAEQGDLHPTRPPGAPPRLDETGRQKLREQVEQNSDLTLEEYAVKYSKEQGVELKKSTIAKYFTRIVIKRKKDLTSELELIREGLQALFKF